MIRSVIEKVSLYNGNDNHDKLYIIELVKLSTDKGKVLGYQVETKYGRRGSVLKINSPIKYENSSSAFLKFENIKIEKICRGYTEVRDEDSPRAIRNILQNRVRLHTSFSFNESKNREDTRKEINLVRPERNITIGDL